MPNNELRVLRQDTKFAVTLYDAEGKEHDLTSAFQECVAAAAPSPFDTVAKFENGVEAVSISFSGDKLLRFGLDPKTTALLKTMAEG